MIDIQDLSVTYRGKYQDTLALDRVSIHINKGEIYTFIGPSGCGKSTLLHVLSGVQKEYSGMVTISGQAVNPKKQRIGLVPQNYGLLAWKTVCKNVLLGTKIKDGRKTLDDYSRYILHQLGIDTLLNRYPKELSGGQQQRVAIARAFILKPDLLLMDEPFSALDAITREEMQELFLNIWKQHRVTTIFITHSVDEALYLGGKIAVFSSAPGRVLRVLANPCFQRDRISNREQYFEMAANLRHLLGSVQNPNLLSGVPD